MKLDKELVRELYNSIGLTSKFFESEGFVYLKEVYPKLAKAYEALHVIVNNEDREKKKWTITIG